MSSFYEKKPLSSGSQTVSINNSVPSSSNTLNYESNDKNTQLRSNNNNTLTNTKIHGNLTPPNCILSFNKNPSSKKDEELNYAKQNLDDTIGKYTNILPYKQGSVTNERRYQCLKCSKSFKRHEHLKRHIITHTGEKLFKCDYPFCNKKFSRSDEVKRHYKIHLTNTIENKIIKQNKKKQMKEEKLMNEELKKKQQMFKLVHDTAKMASSGNSPTSSSSLSSYFGMAENKIVLPPIYQTPNSSSTNLNLFAPVPLNNNNGTKNVLPPLNNRLPPALNTYNNNVQSSGLNSAGNSTASMYNMQSLTPIPVNASPIPINNTTSWNGYSQLIRPPSSALSLNSLINQQQMYMRPLTSGSTPAMTLSSGNNSSNISRASSDEQLNRKTDSEKRMPSIKDILNI